MFAPATQGKAALLHEAIHSADVADLDGWLIGGWPEAICNKRVFCFFLAFEFGGQLVAAFQPNQAINDVPLQKTY